MNISFADARLIADAARERAVALNKPLTIAVVDSGGYPVLMERMDGARPLQPSIAIAKAYTAAVMQRPAKMLKGWQDSQPGFFAQIAGMGLHPIVATDGGMPIKKNGELIGGLGIAGGTGEEDQEICDAVLDALGYQLTFEQFNRIR
jgi:uncharacterized protein GlcG (DUF336 family)